MAEKENEVWGGSPRLIRETEAPERSSIEPGKKARRLKMTGPSYSGLSANISRGNIGKKIAEYNSEYEKLIQIAQTLNGDSEATQGRARYDAVMNDPTATEEDKKKVYEEVVGSVQEYNAQVAKLAKLAVGILVFKEDDLKVRMKSSGRPLRVPNKLVAAMMKLTKGGRKRLEEIAEAEKRQAVLEEEMVEAIVKDAQKIMDTGADAKAKGAEGSAVADWGTDKGLGKYADIANVGAVLSDVVPAPSSDVEEEEKGTSGEKKKPGRMPAINSNAKKIESITEVLAKIKGEETALAGLLGIPSDGKFKMYVKGSPLTLNCSLRSKGSSISLEDWGKVIGSENKEEIETSYNNFVNLCALRDAWLGLEASEEAKTEVVFNYVVAAVQGGKTQEEIRANIPEEFSDEQKAVVTGLTEDFDKLTNGVKGLEAFVDAKVVEKGGAEVEEPKKGEGEEPKGLTDEEKVSAFNRLGVNLYKKERELRITSIQGHLTNVKAKETELSGLIALVKSDVTLFPKSMGEDALKLVYANGKRKNTTVSVEEWGTIVGVAEDTRTDSYNNYINLFVLGEMWEKVAGENLEANEEVFNYVVAAVRDGKTQEEIRTNMPEGFGDEQKAIVTGLTEDFEKLTNGVKGLDEFVGVKVAKNEPVKGEGEGEPVVTPKKGEGEGEPVVTPKKGEGEGEPVVTPKKGEGEGEPVVTPKKGEGEGEPVVTPKKGEGEGEPVVTPRKGEGEGEPVVTPKKEEPKQTVTGGFGARYLTLATDLRDFLKAEKELLVDEEKNKEQLADLRAKIIEIREEMDQIITVYPLGRKKAPVKGVEDPAKNVGTGEPVVEDPVKNVGTGDPVVEDPVKNVGTGDPVVEDPAKKVGTGDPVVEDPVKNVGTGEPVVENPARKVGTGEPVVENPARKVGTGEPVVENPAIKVGTGDPVVEDPAIKVGTGEPVVEDPARKVGTGEPVVENPARKVGTGEPVVEDPARKVGTGEPVVEDPARKVGTGEPVVEDPAKVVVSASDGDKKGISDADMDEIARRTAKMMREMFPGMGAPVVNLNIKGDLNNQGGNFVINNGNASQFSGRQIQGGASQGMTDDFREWWETMSPILNDPDARKKLGVLKGYRDVFASMQSAPVVGAEEEVQAVRKK